MSTLDTPMVNLGTKYINGLNLSFNTTALINVSAGAARDSQNIVDIVLPSAVIVNTAAHGRLGLDTGTLAASTMYHLFVIGDSTMQNAPSVLFSLSATAPTLPGSLNNGAGGYDCFRRIGSFKTDAGSLVLAFRQDMNVNGSNRVMWYDTAISVLAATAAAAMTAQSLAAAVPAAAGATEVILQADLLPNAAANFVQLRATGSSVAAGNVKMSGDVAAVHHFDQLRCPTGIAAGAQSIDWMTDAASTVALTVTGYVDNL